MKRNNIINLAVIVFATTMLTFSCETTEPPPQNKITNTITLKTGWQDLHRIEVNWNISKNDKENNYKYQLVRVDESGKEFIKNFYITGDDTNYVDDNDGDSLKIGTKYSYKVKAFNSSNELKDTSNSLYTSTLSVTSNDIVWEMDTLGQPGNFLYDVWGTDKDNVWAVGYVDLPDGGSGIIKWDGVEWKTFPASSGVKYGLYGFSETSIFVVGESANRGFTAIWDGTNWKEYRYDYFYSRGDTVYSLRAVWGSSNSDVWAVGDRNTIIHWDGSEWKKEEIGNSVNDYRFTDIWGFSNNDIYVIGNERQVEMVIYHFDGNNWDILFRGETHSTINSSIWGPFEDKLYAFDYYKYEITNGQVSKMNIPNKSIIYKVRGSGSNNIYTVGAFGEVFHYNGMDWTRLDEIYSYPLSRALSSCVVFENQMYAVGISSSYAIVIKIKNK